MEIEKERNVPNFLISKLNEEYGENLANKIITGLQENRKTTFRVNRIKSNVSEIEDCLIKNNIKFEKPDFFDDGFILEKNFESKVKSLDIYNSGKIYMQSISAMIPVLVLEPREKENIFDMCAAPRGKNNSE